MRTPLASAARLAPFVIVALGTLAVAANTFIA